MGESMNRRTFNRLAACSGFGLLWPRAALGAVAENIGRGVSVTGDKSSSTPGDYMLGTSYYPEWWEPSEWETDFA